MRALAGCGVMLQSISLPKVLQLVEDVETNRALDDEVWPLPPTNPAITISGINPDGSHFPIEKIEAHVKGLHHQALSIFVLCGDELLIQQRASEKYHCGGLWANTCCSHPHFGEDVAAAADRRLQEELGFQLPLEQRLIVEYSADVGNGLWERERVHMFRADVRSKTDVKVLANPSEVEAFHWVSRAELRNEIERSPHRFTPWFRIYVKEYPELNF